MNLFDAAQLKCLPGALAPSQEMTDATMVRRALLAQMSYLADVATSLPSNVYSTSGGLFRLAWRSGRTQVLALCVRAVFLFLPQPVAACMRSPPANDALSTVSPVCQRDIQPSTWHGRRSRGWAQRPAGSFTKWKNVQAYMRSSFFVSDVVPAGVSVNLLSHHQIPAWRVAVQFRLPVAGASDGVALPLPSPPPPPAELLRDGLAPRPSITDAKRKHQPLLVELPLAFRHMDDVAPPDKSPSSYLQASTGCVH